MSTKTKMQAFQIALLKIYKGYRELDHAFASYKPRSHTPMWDATGYAERTRKQAERELKRLKVHIRHLERYAYIERVKDGEGRLYRLTAKGQYEILRLRFVEHMVEQKEQKWDRKWRIMIFDILEEKRKYRDFMRRLLKSNGFRMWQFSVWVTKYNPEPALRDLLKYLGLHKDYSIIEADCRKCSPQLVKTWRQMRRAKVE